MRDRSVGQVPVLHSLPSGARTKPVTATPLLPRARGARMNSVRTGTFRSSLLVAIASWVVNVSAGTCDAGWVNPYPRWDSVVMDNVAPLLSWISVSS